jgi:hypothetical protein
LKHLLKNTSTEVEAKEQYEMKNQRSSEKKDEFKDSTVNLYKEE